MGVPGFPGPVIFMQVNTLLCVLFSFIAHCTASWVTFTFSGSGTVAGVYVFKQASGQYAGMKPVHGDSVKMFIDWDQVTKIHLQLANGRKVVANYGNPSNEDTEVTLTF
jgi:hypothetical protein